MSDQPIFATAKAACFVCVTDRARAKIFYGERLGLKLRYEDDFGTVFDSNGIAVRISPVEQFRPQPFTVLGWEVPDIDATVKALIGAGIEIIRVQGLPQSELGIWSPATGKFVAWFKDPDGNMLSVAQH